jgi:hypothetical protein
MNKLASLFAFPALILVLLWSSACGKPQPAGLTDPQVTSVTENMLKALDANDYQNFIKDFSDQMISAFTQEQFTHLHTLLGEASGKFVSIGTLALTNTKGYAIYRFHCKYEQETVYVSVTMLIGGQKVEGLWFDSVNLSKAS